jgi:hypothetical protein
MSCGNRVEQGYIIAGMPKLLYSAEKYLGTL